MDRKSDDGVEAGIEIVEDGGGCLCTAEGDTLETTVQHGASGMLEDVDSGLQARDGRGGGRDMGLETRLQFVDAVGERGRLRRRVGDLLAWDHALRARAEGVRVA